MRKSLEFFVVQDLETDVWKTKKSPSTKQLDIILNNIHSWNDTS